MFSWLKMLFSPTTEEMGVELGQGRSSGKYTAEEQEYLRRHNLPDGCDYIFIRTSTGIAYAYPKNALTTLRNSPNPIGMKFDTGKPRFSLVPVSALNEVIKVLELGAQKYAENNWQKVEGARGRYYNAAYRHLTAWFDGEKKDPETGINHLAHVGCNVLFLLWFDLQEEKNANEASKLD